MPTNAISMRHVGDSSAIANAVATADVATARDRSFHSSHFSDGIERESVKKCMQSKTFNELSCRAVSADASRLYPDKVTCQHPCDCICCKDDRDLVRANASTPVALETFSGTT